MSSQLDILMMPNKYLSSYSVLESPFQLTISDFLETSYNGTVCTVKRDGRLGEVQMITFIEKLTNLKYELLMAYLNRDIQFLSSALIEYRNMIIYEIFM